MLIKSEHWYKVQRSHCQDAADPHTANTREENKETMHARCSSRDEVIRLCFFSHVNSWHALNLYQFHWSNRVRCGCISHAPEMATFIAPFWGGGENPYLCKLWRNWKVAARRNEIWSLLVLKVTTWHDGWLGMWHGVACWQEEKEDRKKELQKIFISLKVFQFYSLSEGSKAHWESFWS